MDEKFSVARYFEAHNKIRSEINYDQFTDGISLIESAFQSEKKIITCGNGGSASTASHYITDWNKMISYATGRKFRGISLCDNLGLITAFANDVSYDEVFSGQLKAILDEGDLVIGISGSGNSPNVLNAIEYANKNGAKTLGIVGYDGGKLKTISRNIIWVPSFDMQLCEDIHLMFGHMVMKKLCGYQIRG